MTLPPTMVRELRVTARRAGTYWTRVFIAALALLACLHWFLSPTIASNPAAAGRAVFNMLSLLGFIVPAPLAADGLWGPLRGLLLAAAYLGLVVWAGGRLRREFRSKDCSRPDRWFDWHRR